MGKKKKAKKKCFVFKKKMLYFFICFNRIIAVNYPARDKGVTRHMRGDEAKQHCPDIELVRVPNIREKADLSKYRDAGKVRIKG